ncbi:MAG: hypothetical protein AW07_02099 [Candidatus Accumulibacter sp. SK-11]|nr:MAG: hypothetical protein AW07_02099 [Candidatus Accumulibacter sp. SK-11]
MSRRRDVQGRSGVPGSALEQEQRIRLRWSLVASLLLHLLLWSVLEPFSGAVGRSGAQPPTTGLQATLRMPLAPAAAATPEATADASLALPEGPAAADPPPATAAGDEAAPAAADRQVPAAAPALVVALGERRLAAERPPYLASVLALPPATGTWYFPRRELTLPPVLLDEPLLRPPADSSSLLRGRVLLRVLVAADGAVDRVEVLGSSLPADYGEAAVAAFARLRFRPGEIEGVAVSSEARFEVDFDEAAAGSSHASDRISIRAAQRPRGNALPAPQPTAAER